MCNGFSVTVPQGPVEEFERDWREVLSTTLDLVCLVPCCAPLRLTVSHAIRLPRRSSVLAPLAHLGSLSHSPRSPREGPFDVKEETMVGRKKAGGEGVGRDPVDGTASHRLKTGTPSPPGGAERRGGGKRAAIPITSAKSGIT